MRTHNGKPCRDEQTGDYCGWCSRAESAGEDARTERDRGMSDRLGSQYEAWLDRIGGSA
jgi:hypothetical protein